jgi:transcriptional regulator with XRE-family HTH domain
LGITQREIAEAAGCSQQLVSFALSGRRRPPKRLIEVATQLTGGLPAHVLFEGLPDEPEGEHE